MMHVATIASRAARFAVSPFPASFDGSAFLFGWALFSLTVISCLTAMFGVFLARELWLDRKYGGDIVTAFRSAIFAVCMVAVMRSVPEVAYMIAFAEASPSELQSILTLKRVLDVASLLPVLWWIGQMWLWYPDIILRLKSGTVMIWTASRLPRLWRFASIFALSAALAATVTLGRAFA